jgi:hypothetical protein
MEYLWMFFIALAVLLGAAIVMRLLVGLTRRDERKDL